MVCALSTLRVNTNVKKFQVRDFHGSSGTTVNSRGLSSRSGKEISNIAETPQSGVWEIWSQYIDYNVDDR